MPLQLFWTFVVVSLVIVSAVMGLVAWKAREVPDAVEREKQTNLNPDQLRILAYVAVVVVCLAATMYEMYLFYGEEEEAGQAEVQPPAPRQ